MSQGCEIYKCGSIANEQGGIHALCAQINANKPNNLKLQYCADDGYECSIPQATGTTNATSDFMNWYCQATTTPVVSISLAPGDICSTDDQCYGQGTCVSNVCAAANPNVGASCADIVINNATVHGGDKMCATGQYCQVNPSNPETATCQSVLNIGDQCSNDDQCGFGAACIYTVCVQWGSLAHGALIEESSQQMMCESSFAQYFTETQSWNCLNAPVTNVDPTTTEFEWGEYTTV